MAFEQRDAHVIRSCYPEGGGYLHYKVSQISHGRRCYGVNATSEAAADAKTGKTEFDIEAVFRARYAHVARVIARIVRDPARAEELAVEVFLKLWRNQQAQGEKAEGWLYRTAVRTALDELRRQTRRNLMNDWWDLSADRHPRNCTPQQRNKSESVLS